MSEDNCGKCGRKVGNRDNGINCEKCKLWYHAGCEGMCVEYYKGLKRQEDELWFCKSCKVIIKQGLGRLEDLEKENLLFKAQIQEYGNEIQELRLEIENLKASMVNVGNTTRQDTQRQHVNEEEIVDKVTDKVTERMIEYMNEKEDMEKRRKNVVMYNIPEVESENVEERIEQDKGMCKDIIENSLGLAERDYNIVKVIRIGKRRNEEGAKPRPTLIKLEDEEQKWCIVRSAKNLKNERDPVKKRVGIVKDMTEKERKVDFFLKQQLRDKKRDGEEGWYIKNGQLMRARERRRNY